MSIDLKEQLGNMIGHNAELQKRVKHLEVENERLKLL